MRPLLAILLIAALAGCEVDGAEVPAAGSTGAATETAAIPDTIPEPADAEAAAAGDSEADENACGAEKLDRWLNALPTDDVKAAISETVGERPIRYYTQGDPITMDFSSARLNVELGEDGRIKLFRCG